MTDVSTTPPVFEQLTLPTPNMVFVLFKERGVSPVTRDGRTSIVSSGEVVSIWETMEGAVDELNAIVNEIGEEEYARMEEDFVILIFEAKK